MIRDAIQLLTRNEPLPRETAREALREIMRGEATPAQIAAFITALNLRGETSDIIIGCAEAMREASTRVDSAGLETVDIVGTGGDGARTFNVSTCAAIVAAAAGVTVAKHGSRRASSQCGSADVLQALGVNIECSPERMAGALRDIGIAFLFAITLHPAMKHAAGPRRDIGIRTIFNILGPLSNPAGSRRGVIGVYHLSVAPLVAHALPGLGADHMWVVHGSDGLDEITITGETSAWEVRGTTVREFTIKPEDAGLKRHSIGAIAGGDAAYNAEIIRGVLAGKPGAARDIVLLNAGAALVTADRARDLREGVALAARAVDSGEAMNKLNALIRYTSQAG